MHFYRDNLFYAHFTIFLFFIATFSLYFTPSFVSLYKLKKTNSFFLYDSSIFKEFKKIFLPFSRGLKMGFREIFVFSLDKKKG